MKIREKIQSNPYRILGVYVGSLASLELRNKNKIAAYSRVGQSTSFSFPIDEKLDGIDRTEELAEKALQTLALPKDRLENALFWIGDGKSEWCLELNNAVYSLLEGYMLKAAYHYGNIFYNETLRCDFQQAVTNGLMNLSPGELTNMLCAVLIHDDGELISAFTQADVSVTPNPIIKQLCDRTIVRNLESLISCNNVIFHIMVNNKFEIDFYSSFEGLVTKINELLPMIKVIGWVYGEDSSKYEEYVERIIRVLYQNAASIIEAIGKWVWIYNKKTMKNGERYKLISARTRQCVDSCMHFISKINDFVASTVDRLHPSQNSIRILGPVKYNYELSLNREYIMDELQIRQAVKLSNRSRVVSDIIWLAILSLIFFLV